MLLVSNRNCPTSMEVEDMDSSCSDSIDSEHGKLHQHKWREAGPNAKPADTTDGLVDVCVVPVKVFHSTEDRSINSPWDLFEDMDEHLAITAAQDWMKDQLNDMRYSRSYVHIINDNEPVSTASSPLNSQSAAQKAAVGETHVAYPHHHQYAPEAWSAQLGYPYPTLYYAMHPGYGCIPQLVSSMDDLEMPVMADASVSVCGACFNLAHCCMCLL